MAKLTYNEWKKLVPENTRKFFIYFARYMDIGTVSFEGERYGTPQENIFVKMVNAFFDLSEINKAYIKKYKNHELITKEYPSEVSEKKELRYFAEAYQYFCIYDEVEKYKILTDDDIFLNMLDKLKDFSNTTRFSFEYDGLIKEIKEYNDEVKRNTEAAIDKNNYEDKSINQINYMEMAGKIFGYLRDNSELITIVDPTKNNLKAISLLASYFLYNQIDSVNYYNTKDVINDCLISEKFSISVLENILGVKFDLDLIEKYDPTLIVDYYFSTDDFNYSHLVESENYQLALKKILSEANLGLDFLRNKSFMINTYSKINSKEVDKYFSRCPYELNEDIDFLIKATTYLAGKNVEVIDYYDDMIEIAILILMLNKSKNLKEYLNDNGLDINRLSEILGLDVSLDKIDSVEINNAKKYKLKKYLFKYFTNIKIKSEDITLRTFANFLYADTKTTAFNRVCSVCGMSRVTADIVYKYVDKKESNRIKEIEDSLFMGLSSSTIKYIKSLSNNYPTSNITNKELIASLRAINDLDYRGEYSDLREYMRSLNIPSLINYDYLGKYDIELIKDKFAYIFELEDINIYTILEEIYKRAQKDYFYEQVDKKNKDSFINIKNKVKLYKEQEEISNKKSQYVTMSIDLSIKASDTLHYATKVYKYLENNKDTFELTYNQRKDLSIIIASLKVENDVKEFFINNNFTLALFDDIDFKEVDATASQDFEAYMFEDYIEKNHLQLNDNDRSDKKEIDYNKIFTNDSIIKKICDENNIKYDYLRYEVEYKKHRELTEEEKFNRFSTYKVPSINTTSITDLAHYGDELSTYSNYINSNYASVIKNENMDNALNEINSLVESIYEKQEEPKNFFARIFKTEEVKVVNINSEVVSNITTTINNNIQMLYNEIAGYEAIIRYIEVYMLKQKDYLKNLKKEVVNLDAELLELQNSTSFEADDISKIINDSKIMDLRTRSQIIRNKKSRFENSQELMRQELLKLHQMILTHNITINSLTTAKDDIIPLIASELAINIGKQSEIKALEVSNNLVGLLQNVINKNVEATYESLELLKDANLPIGTYDKMAGDINIYLDGVKQGQLSLEEPIKKELKK